MEDYYEAYNLLVELILESDKKVQCLLHIHPHLHMSWYLNESTHNINAFWLLYCIAIH